MSENPERLTPKQLEWLRKQANTHASRTDSENGEWGILNAFLDHVAGVPPIGFRNCHNCGEVFELPHELESYCEGCLEILCV